ncbi:MAG TPA: polynucleotide kinase-phosphatase [Candidatus Dormibacteraeota bacterium]|nr:polynucleotide kinase-phosphatase [Candidatus Dormibacteraeota bacterium]
MKISVPELSLVVLIGASGSGKSSFARKHFLPTEILSSDYCRGLVSDNENDLSATNDAFEILHFIAAKRLAAGRLTVVDATNVQLEARKPLIELARRFHALPVAIVLNLPEKLCHERNQSRPDRNFGPHVVRQHTQQLRRSLRGLQREGFRHVAVFSSVEEIDAATIAREPLYNNKKEEKGPFDIIGDIHGCFEELVALLKQLGYVVTTDTSSSFGIEVVPPAARRAVFVGDLVDRGPNTPAVLRLVMGMIQSGTAFCVPGNHDIKLMRKLKGKDVQISHGLAESLAQLDQETPEFRKQATEFLDSLISHYVFDSGKLVVAHAGMKEEMQGRGSGKVRDFALFGETTGETDEFGLPVRYNWAAEYRGRATVVYGHTPIPESEWLNRTINIDTGCVFGGKLTALRYPELELVSVPAAKTYAEPARPFLKNEDLEGKLSSQQELDDLLDLDDVFGKRIVSTRLHHNVTIREENATAALEVMSRFAANPKWLIYLPPTMSPSETTKVEGLLEHPAEAFAYFRQEGVPRVICEEKHMGSRAVLVVCRDEETARKRFGVVGGESGICYTRTGRRFFDDPSLESQLFARIRKALNEVALWDLLKTDWACLDAELMPWSAKAQELLRRQYAPVGSAGRAATKETVLLLDEALQNNIAVQDLAQSVRNRELLVGQFVEAYRQYCWPVQSLDDLRLAPFHLLATEGAVHVDKDHEWHMQQLAKICAADPKLLLATPHHTVDLTKTDEQEQAIQWWTELTSRGGEGMVVKPLRFIEKGRRGIVQPAVKCRGKEYLRIIYGPDYTLPEHLARLRSRGLSSKRSLALREFALGVEGLERFVRKEPLRRVHECVFGVLALESEPVDPRL